MRPQRPVMERLLEQVEPEPNTGCLLWTGSLCNGYGSIGRVVDGKWKAAYAHRVVWESLNGPVPAGCWILHRCDTRSCCSIDHLWLGTRRDNINDMALKGRGSTGTAGLPFGVRRAILQSTGEEMFWAQVQCFGKRYHSCGFRDVESAAAAASELKRSLYGPVTT